MDKLILESVSHYCFQNCGLTGEQWLRSLIQKYSGMNRYEGWKPRAVLWSWLTCSFRRVRYFENDAGTASCVPRKAKYCPDSDSEQVVWTKDEKYSEKRVISTWNWQGWITLDTCACDRFKAFEAPFVLVHWLRQLVSSVSFLRRLRYWFDDRQHG